jgi:hypothetical protein
MNQSRFSWVKRLGLSVSLGSVLGLVSASDRQARVDSRVCAVSPVDLVSQAEQRMSNAGLPAPRARKKALTPRRTLAPPPRYRGVLGAMG